VGGPKLMKGIKKVENKNEFILSLNIEELTLIKNGLEHIKFNYINIINDSKELISYRRNLKKFKEIQKLLITTKKLLNETEDKL